MRSFILVCQDILPLEQDRIHSNGAYCIICLFIALLPRTPSAGGRNDQRVENIQEDIYFCLPNIAELVIP